MKSIRQRRPGRLAILLIVAVLLAGCPADDPQPGDGAEADPAPAALEKPGEKTPGPAESRVERVLGKVTVADRGPVSQGDLVAQGAEIRLTETAELELAFHDGARLAITGPARFSLPLLAEKARTIELEEGRIHRLAIHDAVTGVHTPFDAFVAARDSVISVEVSSGESARRATFTLVEGNDAKVVADGKVRLLAAGESTVVTAGD